MGAAPTQRPDHKRALWEAILDAHLNVIYWDAMSRRYTRIDTAFRILIAVATSATVAAWGIWADHQAYWKALSATACVASLIHPLMCSSDKLKKMSSLVGMWKELRTKYELLWEQDTTIMEPKNWKQFETLQQRQAKVERHGCRRAHESGGRRV